MTVCEIVRDLPAQEGKIVAALGRYSFRSTGRWMSEESCEGAAGPTELWMVEDLKSGPKPPEHMDLDRLALRKKLAAMQPGTALGKFRFGTSDYDRWAIVYGRVEKHKSDGRKSAADLVFRGNAVIILLTANEW